MMPVQNGNGPDVENQENQVFFNQQGAWICESTLTFSGDVCSDQNSLQGEICMKS